MKTFTVEISWDDEAGVWYSHDGDIPGLILQSNSLEALMERLRLAAPDLLDAPDNNAIELHFKAERRISCSTQPITPPTH
jgi:predicted RNase H-like HicB family nuclease